MKALLTIPLPPEERIYTYQQIAAHFNVDVRSIRMWMNQMNLPRVKPTSRTVRVPERSFAKLREAVETITVSRIKKPKQK